MRLPKLNRLGIPEKVLLGKVYKYRSVANLYKARLIQELMRQVNRSFWARAKGGTDELGNKWKPLAPSTHAYKPLSPMEKKTYSLDGKRTRGLLTPAQDRKWRRIFAKNLKIFERKGDPDAKKKAAAIAWSVLISEGAQTLIGLGRVTDINIRTGRLVAATKEGSVANNRYYPPKAQKVKLSPRSIHIGFDIEYIKEVDAVRPVIPADISVWILRAHEVAIPEAKALYDSIQNNTPNRKKLPPRGKRKRN
jgi:hypothetical protein